MSGSIDNLVKMANQIGDFFGTMKDRRQSLEEIAAQRVESPMPRITRKPAMRPKIAQISGQNRETPVKNFSVSTNQPPAIATTENRTIRSAESQVPSRRTAANRICSAQYVVWKRSRKPVAA